MMVAADVRIDNRRELLSDLAVNDRSPDPLLLAAAYARWGRLALSHIVGEYALAVADKRCGSVLIARDPVGRRPLAWTTAPNGTIAFASNALSLASVRQPRAPAVDHQKIIDTLSLDFSQTRTFLEGVSYVEPGEVIEISGHGVFRKRWWTFPGIVARDTKPGGITDHTEALATAFETAVSAACRGLGPIGAQLSGGIDSSAVAAVAALKLSPETLLSYTARPPGAFAGPSPAGRDADESSLVRDLLCLHPTIDPRFVEVTGAGLFPPVSESLWQLGAGPDRNPCNGLWISEIYRMASEDGVLVLLSGGAGNAAFSADGPGWLVELFQDRAYAELVREARQWARVSGQSLISVFATLLVWPQLKSGQRLRIRRLLKQPFPLDSWRESCALRPRFWHRSEVHVSYPHLDPSRVVPLRQALAHALYVHSGQAESRAAAAVLWGFDLRDPTADRRVLETSAVQPERVRRHNGTTRAVARATLRSTVPDSIRLRTRRGAQLPDWLDRMTEARAEIRAEMSASESHALTSEYIDVERLRRLVDAWPALSRSAEQYAIRNYRFALWRGLATSRYLRWLEEHLAQLPSPPRAPHIDRLFTAVRAHHSTLIGRSSDFIFEVGDVPPDPTESMLATDLRV